MRILISLILLFISQVSLASETYVGVYSRVETSEHTGEEKGIELVIEKDGNEFWVAFTSIESKRQPTIHAVAKIINNSIEFEYKANEWSFVNKFVGKFNSKGIYGGFTGGTLIIGEKKSQLIKINEPVLMVWPERKPNNAFNTDAKKDSHPLT